jgi:hypothetical protein
MCQAFILRCQFQGVFGGIGTCSSDPCNIGTGSDQVDNLILFLRFR